MLVLFGPLAVTDLSETRFGNSSRSSHSAKWARQFIIFSSLHRPHPDAAAAELGRDENIVPGRDQANVELGLPQHTTDLFAYKLQLAANAAASTITLELKLRDDEH